MFGRSLPDAPASGNKLDTTTIRPEATNVASLRKRKTNGMTAPLFASNIIKRLRSVCPNCAASAAVAQH